MPLLTLTIPLKGSSTKKDFDLRYTLVDTIEERGIGEVIEEGTGDRFMQVVIELDKTDEKEQEIRQILKSLDLLSMTDFDWM